MLPEGRAAADKVIYDAANLRYIAENAGKKGLEKRAPATGWTVRQTIGHLAFALHSYADSLPVLTGVEPGNPGGFDVAAFNAETAARTEKMPLPRILEELADGRDRCIDAFLALAEGDLDRPAGGAQTVRDLLRIWQCHFETHALDLLDAMPVFEQDPMVLNWVLHADFSAQPGLLERRQQLAARVREWLLEHQEDE
ncbi:MAG: DinB family protein [Hyphomicrobiales bacterium]